MKFLEVVGQHLLFIEDPDSDVFTVFNITKYMILHPISLS